MTTADTARAIAQTYPAAHVIERINAEINPDVVRAWALGDAETKGRKTVAKAATARLAALAAAAEAAELDDAPLALDAAEPTPEPEPTNPINAAIDALYDAFVGAPTADAGTPEDFATGPTLCVYCAESGFDTLATCEGPVIVQTKGGIFANGNFTDYCDECVAVANSYPELPSDEPADEAPKSLAEAVVCAAVDTGRLADVTAALRAEYSVGSVAAVGMVNDAAKAGLVELDAGAVTLTVAGHVLAVERGWCDPAPEHIAEEQGGCDDCDPRPADFYGPVITNGPQATGTDAVSDTVARAVVALADEMGGVADPALVEQAQAAVAKAPTLTDAKAKVTAYIAAKSDGASGTALVCMLEDIAAMVAELPDAPAPKAARKAKAPKSKHANGAPKTCIVDVPRGARFLAAGCLNVRGAGRGSTFRWKNGEWVRFGFNASRMVEVVGTLLTPEQLASLPGDLAQAVA